MTGEQSIALRGAIGALGGACSIASWKLAPRLRLSSRDFSRLFLGAFALSRLGLFTLAMLILHLTPRGDITLYMEEAAPALAGKLVYRDFITPHAPLDPYLLSSMLRLHHSPLTIIVFGILFDILAMWIWMKAARYFLPTLTLRRAALLVLFNPTSLLTEGIDGQMNSFIALFLALGVYFLVVKRDEVAGICVAIPTAVIKFLSLIYAPGYLFASRRKLSATLGFVLLLVVVYGGFALAGANIAVPLHAEGDHRTASNLIFLIGMVTGHPLGLRAPDLLLALSWFSMVGLTFISMRACDPKQPEGRRRILTMLTLSLIAELLCVQIFSKNTWDRYLVMAMFPLCTLVARMSFGEIVAFGIWAMDAVVEPSYWATVLNSGPAERIHPYLVAREPHVLFMLLLEVVYVSGSIYLFAVCVRQLLRLRRADPALNEAPDYAENSLLAA